MFASIAGPVACSGSLIGCVSWKAVAYSTISPTLTGDAAGCQGKSPGKTGPNPPAGPGLTWGSYSRGFVGSVAAQDIAAFLTQAAAIFAAGPVQRLRVYNLSTADLEAAFMAMALRRLRELDLGGNLLRNFGAQALVEC